MAWGEDEFGQLGNGRTIEHFFPEPLPEEVKTLTEAIAVSGGGEHSLALLKNRKVMAWGENESGQLGNGTTTNSDEPVEVKQLGRVTAVAAGGEHSLALLKNGKVMAWGNDESGQLGNGKTQNSSVPVEVSGLTDVVAIAAGDEFSIALLKNGSVMTWGSNLAGELGNGTTENSDVPIAVKELSGVTSIAAGEYHSLAVLANGSVKAWGENNTGALGIGIEAGGPSSCPGLTPCSMVPVTVDALSEAVAVAGGYGHSMALLKNGTVKAWGYNYWEQTGAGSGNNANVLKPKQVVGQEGTLGPLSEVTAIAAGGYHSMALLKSGAVVAWGENFFGQGGEGPLYTGTPTEVKPLVEAISISAGHNHSLAIQARP